MYALVEIKGHQFRAEKGSVLQIDHVEAENGTTMEFDSVLLVGGDKGVQIGAPYVKGAKVKAVVDGQMRDGKVISYKYKRRKSYHRTVGHRQQYTLIKVEDLII
jgi:large subunit ribosomal protein L21